MDYSAFLQWGVDVGCNILTVLAVSLKWIVDNMLTALATLIAAFCGAWFAYRLQYKTKKEEQRSINLNAAQRALFIMFQQLNCLALYQKDMIDPVRNDPGIAIKMHPVLPDEYNDFQYDFNSLSFLLNTKHKQVILDLFIEQQRFQAAIKAINYRSALHTQELQPRLDNAGIQEGVNYKFDEILVALGNRVYTTLFRATDQVVYHVDRTILTLQETKDKMLMAFKDLFPEGKFLNIELLDETTHVENV